MSEPSTFQLACAAASSSCVVGVFRRIWRRLPSWHRHRIEYRVPDPYGVVLRGDLWCVTLRGCTYLTQDKTAMENLLDHLDESQAEMQQVPWHGKTRRREVEMMV